MQVVGAVSFTPGPNRDIFFILLFLIYMIPASFSLAGGMPASGWLWYAAAAALYAAATISVTLGASYFFLALIPVSLICLAMANRTAPHVLAELGYTGSSKPIIEIVFTILIAGVLISYTWIGQVLIRKSGFEVLPVTKYLLHLSICTLYYFPFWGILLGLLMRRFLDMRYEVTAPIALNTTIMSVYWMLSLIGRHNMKVHYMIAGAVLQAIASQASLGLAFNFFRSTRPLLAAYVIYYLFLQTVVF